MKKMIVNILLFFLLLLEFSRNYMEPIYHEIIGVLLLILVIIHLVLNWSYMKNLTKGKYSLSRWILLIINLLFFISFFLSLIFGILSSRDLFPNLSLHNLTVISLHKVFSYISLICMGLHLGTNFYVMFGKISKKMNFTLKWILGIFIIGFGIYSFIDLDIVKHITGTYGFSIVTGNIIVSILKYFSVVMMISILTHIIYSNIRKG
ncbi:MAG: DUF4405 domain-containing protein [Bacilli bacterium]|nr:DUF4405 domain-containing protein [Bacilli bacterium]